MTIRVSEQDGKISEDVRYYIFSRYLGGKDFTWSSISAATLVPVSERRWRPLSAAAARSSHRNEPRVVIAIWMACNRSVPRLSERQLPVMLNIRSPTLNANCHRYRFPESRCAFLFVGS